MFPGIIPLTEGLSLVDKITGDDEGRYRADRSLMKRSG
jgi:hypothetical protein